MTDGFDARKEDKRPDQLEKNRTAEHQVIDPWDREEIFNYKQMIQDSGRKNTSDSSLPNVAVVDEGDDHMENKPKEPEKESSKRNPMPKPRPDRQWPDIIQNILDMFPDLAK